MDASDPSAWNRVQSELEALDELQPGEHEEYLARLKSEDPELESAVRRVLEPDAVPDSFLKPAVEAETDAVAGILPGTRIGRYELKRRVGSGGMGSVYEALQANPSRTVALKLMQLSAATPDALRRFRYESELLGRLRHPAIAQVFESGSYRLVDGNGGLELPWFAMEYVEGARTLLAYVEQARLDRDDRIRLFQEVCAAVQHGHQRGVIHRDLKPSNLLVDAEGQPKVIDYGVARPVERDSSDASQVTMTGDVVGTLRYMSPEQLSGDPGAIDVRTDVYSLGVVLFELLTGDTPHNLDGMPLHEAARVIHESVNPRPSSLAPDLPPDLDWIVLKALEVDPERRYASAEQLEADLQRYLDHEPVLAGAPSAVYRARKFVRRNKVAVVAATFVALALLAGAGFANMGRIEAKESAEEATESAAQAKSEARKAEEANRFLSDLFLASSVLNRGRATRVVDLLDDARARLDTDYREEPEVRASLQASLGYAFHGLGLYPESVALLGPALEFERSRLGQDDPSVITLFCTLCLARRMLGEQAEFDVPLAEAYERSERIHGPAHPSTVALQKTLAAIRFDQRRFAEAIELFEGAMELDRTSEPEDGSDPARVLVQYRDLGQLSNYYHGAGRFEEAKALSREAYEGVLEARGPDDGNTLLAQAQMCHLLVATGYREEAIGLIEEVSEKMREVLGDNHLQLIHLLMDRANVYRTLGRLQESREVYEDVISRLEAHYGESSSQTLMARGGLGATLVGLLEWDAAEEIFEGIIAFEGPGAGPSERTLMNARTNLATVYRRQERHEEADALFLELIEPLQRSQGSGASIKAVNNLAVHWMKQKRWAEAEALLAPRIPLLREFPTPEPYWLGQILGMHGRCLVFLGRNEEAEGILLEAHELLLKLYPPTDVAIRYQATSLTWAYEGLGRDEDAELWRERALATK